jgi:ERCC4-type nuclease
MLNRLSHRYGGDCSNRNLFWDEEYPANVPPPTLDEFNRFDPGLRSYPIPTPIKLLADHREPPELISLLSCVSNLDVEVVSLEIGDYVVDGMFAIERKAPIDFAQSVIGDDKRLFHQAQNMLQAGFRSIVLLEGDVYANRSMTIQQVDGMLSYLTMKGIHLFHSRSQVHSAAVIAKIARHMVFGLGYPDRERYVNHRISRDTSERGLW